MIVSIQGTLQNSAPPYAVVECAGIGYEVMLPARDFTQLPPVGQKVNLFTSMIVREDSQTLYGFINARDRKLFTVLIRINGIGAKSAIGLLSVLDGPALAQAVETNSVKTLTRAPGIGAKSAQRLILELRGNEILLETPAATPLVSMAIEALITLGFPATKARTAIAGIDLKDKDVGEIVKLALTELSGSK